MRGGAHHGAGVLAWALALAAALLCGCGGSGGLRAAGDFTPRKAGTLTVATAQIPDPGFWGGTPQRPQGGFEYGLAKALAARFGLKRVAVKLVPFAQITAGNLGGADLALSDITVTSTREAHVDFSVPYLKAPPAILVRPGTEVPDVHAARELRFAVQRGTTLEEDLQGAIEPLASPMLLAHQREVLQALRAGRANAVMLDLPVALAYAHESPKRYEVAAQLPSEDVLAVALPKGSSNVQAVDSALHAFNANGTIEGLGKRWLATELTNGGAEDIPALRTEPQ